MKQKIQTKLSKIRNKLFSTRKMKIVSVLIFLAVGGAIFFSANYFAKGATYGWLQATWSGGADESAVADHTNNQTLWTKFFSKDTNVDTASDQLTLTAGTSNVTDTTTAQFDAGTKSDSYMIDTSSVADQMTVNPKYYNGAVCGVKGVYYVDSGTATWANALTTCTALCPNCALPTLTELTCMCTNKASFGNNFVADYYWSASQRDSTFISIVLFSNCSLGANYKTLAYYVRCVRR